MSAAVQSTENQPKHVKKKNPECVQTIKTKLHTKRDAVRQWINYSVDLVSEVAVHVSRFSNMYVLYCLSNHLKLPKLDSTMFCKMIALVTGTDDIGEKRMFTDPQMKDAFNILYKPLLGSNGIENERTPDAYRILKALAKEMETNVKVYLSTQFLIRFRQWCKDFVNKMIEIQPRAPNVEDLKLQRYKVTNYLFKQCSGSGSNVIDVETLQAEANAALASDCVLIWSNEIAIQLSREISDFRQLLCTERVIKQNRQREITCDNTKDLRPITKWKLENVHMNHAYMKWLYKYLVELEKNNLDRNQKQKKVFSLMPIRGLDRCYISICNTALRYWIYRHRKNRNAVGSRIFKKLIGIQNNEKKFIAEFKMHSLWYWKQLFDLKKVLRTQDNVIFDGPLLTDGVGCSITTQKMSKLLKKKEKVKESSVITLQDDKRTTDQKIEVLSEAELAESDVLGVDPGRNTLFTSAIEMPNGKYNITKYSAAKWRQMSSGNAAKRKRENWSKAQSPEYNTWLLAMPTTKVATVAAMQVHVRHLMLRFEECFALNGKKRVRNQRMTSYIQKQKSLSSMVNEFLGQQKAVGSTKKKLIVAFGDASFKTSGPTRKMKEELKRRKNVTIVNVDEFHTSLMTNCCAFAKGREAKAVERVGPVCEQVCKKDGSISKKSSYSVTFCQGCSCIWNRDVNAAINMLQVYRHSQKNNGARHPFFSRNVATSKKQKRGEKRKAERRSKAAGQIQPQIKIVDEKKKRKVEVGSNAVKKVVPKIYIVPDKKRKIVALASSSSKKKKIEQKGVSSDGDKAVCSLDSTSDASVSNTSDQK